MVFLSPDRRARESGEPVLYRARVVFLVHMKFQFCKVRHWQATHSAQQHEYTLFLTMLGTKPWHIVGKCPITELCSQPYKNTCNCPPKMGRISHQCYIVFVHVFFKTTNKNKNTDCTVPNQLSYSSRELIPGTINHEIIAQTSLSLRAC